MSCVFINFIADLRQAAFLVNGPMSSSLGCEGVPVPNSFFFFLKCQNDHCSRRCKCDVLTQVFSQDGRFPTEVVGLIDAFELDLYKVRAYRPF